MTDDTHHQLALWAADCAEHVLPIFEAVRPNDDRPRLAIEAIRLWANDEIKVTPAKEAAGASQNATRELTGISEAARMAALSAGQAAYAICAVMESAPKPEREATRIAECDWQRSRLPAEIRELVLDDQRLRNDICWNVFEGRQTDND